jgi:PmbA protein
MIEKVCRDLNRRCRWFDIIETRGSSVPVQFKNNRLHSVQEKENSGLGVRVNIGDRTGFSYTNISGRLEAAAERACVMAPYGDEERFDLPGGYHADCDPYDPAIEAFNVEREIGSAESLIEMMLASVPGAVIDIGITVGTGSVGLVNSSGGDATYRTSSYSAGISLTLVMDDGAKLDMWEGLSCRAPVDYAHLADRILERTVTASRLARCASGRLPLLFTPKAAARIMGIVASGLSARAVWKGISPFAGRLGELAFNEGLTLYDDPRLDGSPYSYPFDDEGVMATRKALIHRGVIASFVTDLKHAHRLGIAALGNGGRGYASLPSPSFSNTVIEAGSAPVNAMIASLDRAIMVDQFIGLGQSNTITGDFSANLDLAYLIERGEIAGRVKDCMVSGNLFELLKGDIVLSLERERFGATLTPYMLVPGVNYTARDA